MRSKILLSTLLIAATILPSVAQTPLWQGKGRIAISSDGNEHDHDDWSATPLSLAMLASRGLQDKLAVYTYSDHIWGSNQITKKWSDIPAYDQMRESALGGAAQFGFDPTRFICAVDNAEIAYNAMRDEINKSSAENPLFIIGAGPMQVIGEAINRSDVDKRKYITVITHSRWNNMHADNPNPNLGWDVHSGWTFDEMEDAFSSKEGGEATFVRILDQNRGKDYPGLLTPKERYDWVKTSSARNKAPYKKGSWDWLYSRLETFLINGGDNFDPSDAGMVIYLITGIEKTSPELVREIMENPTVKK